MASRVIAKQSKKCYAEYLDQIVQIRYIDHVQFRRADASQIEPSIRLLVGWLITDCPDYIRVYYDKPVLSQQGEKTDSGFMILKDLIIEVLELRFSHKQFKHTTEPDNGQSAL